MQTSRLGRSGCTVSRLGLGTAGWGRQVSLEEAREQLELFLDSGGTLVDTAHAYPGSEEMLGAVLDEVGRDEVVLSTKAGMHRRGADPVVDASRGRLMRELDASLMALRTDHVDLWLIHRYDAATPLEETASALVWAHQSGRARYVGVSNFRAWQTARLMTLLEREGVALVASQEAFSLVDRDLEPEVPEAATALGLGVIAYSPLGSGVLTGKYRTGIPSDSRATRDSAVRARLSEDNRAVIEAAATAAEGLGTSPAHVALAWVLAHEWVSSALVGPRTTGQFRQLLGAVDLVLPDQIRFALDEVS